MAAITIMWAGFTKHRWVCPTAAPGPESVSGAHREGKAGGSKDEHVVRRG